MPEFDTTVHLLTVFWCVSLIAVFVGIGLAGRSRSWLRRFEIGVGAFGLAFWLFKVTWYSWTLTEGRFYVPLNLCNLSEVVCDLSLLTRRSWLRPLVYFWAIAALPAFITPEVRATPDEVIYWLFWMPHTLILGVAAYEIIVARFRPTLKDVGIAFAATLAYVAVVFPINLIFGTNYGYVGPSKPDVPTLIDVFGPWPLRVLWIMLLGAALILLAWLPWFIAKKGR